MRLVHAAALTVAALLLASIASAQGLGDAAAKERQKRKAAPAKPAKVYTDGDIGTAMAPASSEAAPAQAASGDEGEAKGEQAEGQEATEGGKTDAEKAADEQKKQAEAAWRKKLDQARKQAAVYQDVIDKLQLELNDTSGGYYNPNRAAKIAFQDENKQLLAETQGKIAALEEEGRRNGYQ
jgi:hypothetical protein